MLKSTRMWGLGVLVFVIVPVVIAMYGIITGTSMFAADGRGIVMLIMVAMVAMSCFTFQAASRIDVTDEVVEEKNAKLVGEQRTSECAGKKGFAH